MRTLYIFPIKKNRIIFHSYKGTQYSCSPKYITEYILSNNLDYEVIWAFKKTENFKYLENKGIKLVKYASFKRFYFEATSKFSINNIGSFSWLPTRYGQYHINTWHGGGCYKKVSLSEIKNHFFEKKNLLLTAKETSLYISSSKFFSDNIIRKEFGYTGEILNCGLPRNDIFYYTNIDNIRKEVLHKLDINEDTYIILYAPTWRYNTFMEIEQINFDALKKLIESIINKKCIFLCRTHHLSNVNWFENTLDVSQYSDMQELLCISDLLITDYSSCIWDFSIQKKPIFLYTPDLSEYIKKRGFVVDISKWGYPICKNETVLENKIKKFYNNNLQIDYEKHQKMLNSFENGNACELVVNWISNKLNGEN